jgi:hypothetical protein
VLRLGISVAIVQGIAPELMNARRLTTHKLLKIFDSDVNDGLVKEP